MEKKIGALACAGAVTLLAAACGQASVGARGASSPSSSGSAVKPCIVSDASGFDDASFNQSGLKGLEAAASQHGLQSAWTESRSRADFAPDIASLVQQSCTLVVAAGPLLADATGQAADANPGIQFAQVDAAVEPPRDNVKALLFDTAQAAYLAGYVAAGTTGTGVVATYGGVQLPSVTIFMDGFVDGVTRYNQDEGTDVKVLGWDKATQTGSFTGDFDDVGAGRSTTQNFIDRGADVVLPVAGPVGTGSLTAARAANDGGGRVRVIWVVSDGYDQKPDFRDLILTTVLKQTGAAVQEAVSTEVAGTFSSEPYVGTLANGGVGLAPFHDLDAEVPQQVKDGVAALEQQIIDGSLVVTSPSTP